MDSVASFQQHFRRIRSRTNGNYELLAASGAGFAARCPDGLPALIIPLAELPHGAVGRRSGGCELLAFSELLFKLESRAWAAPAAVLRCLDEGLLDVFAVVAMDVLSASPGTPDWTSISLVLEDWFALLHPRPKLSAEAELGLWGEIWFLSRALDPHLLFQAWRGPEMDSTDFFLRNVSVELKTSRTRHQHHVSQTQVGAPAGDATAWFLSVWVKPDPGAPNEMSLSGLVTETLRRTSDRAATLRQLARLGYSPSDHATYLKPYAILEEPHWFAARSIPRVRSADSGISRLRYHVDLNDIPYAATSDARGLWQHFHGRPYP